MSSDPAATTPSQTSTEPLGVTLMLILTMVTGIVDAVGYLGLDRVFVGNMTGNIVILGMGAAGADDLPVLGPVIALATFAAAAYLTGLFLRHAAAGWSTRVTVALCCGTVILILCSATLFVLELTPVVQVVTAAATAAAMGTQACVARKVGVKDMTTVVVTSTLTSLAGETWAAKGTRNLLNRRVGAIAVIFLGALVGALLLDLTHIGVPMTVAALLSLGVAAVGHRRLRTTP